MVKNPRIDLIADEQILSESVYADCVSPNGRNAVIVRLCRYPEQSISWLWIYCFLTQGTYGYNNNYLPSSKNISLVEEPDIIYRQSGQEEAIFRRNGPRDSPIGAHITVNVRGHKGSKNPQNPGPHKIQIEGDFKPKYKPWKMNRYRTEWLSTAKIVVNIDDNHTKFDGYGHWHEQHQIAPRWKTRFTYLSLRGKELSLIGTATEPNDSGFIVKSSKRVKINKIKIDPPSEVRNINIKLDDYSSLEGKIHTAHKYWVPVYSRWLEGTIVRAEIGKVKLTGCVNDWII
ncbi:MAG: hypothetical protein ACFFEN_16865 [Candidatus Thorarchaeota archaeon]